MTKHKKHDDGKIANKTNSSPKKGRTPSFATFVKNDSCGTYKYDKKRNVIRIIDGFVTRDVTEDGKLAYFKRKYCRKYLTK
jgi:hypothetical protein